MCKASRFLKLFFALKQHLDENIACKSLFPLFFQAKNSSNSTTRNVRQNDFFPEPKQGR